MKTIERREARLKGYAYEVSQDPAHGVWLLALYREGKLLFCGQLPDLISPEEAEGLGEAMAQLHGMGYESGSRAAYHKVAVFAQTYQEVG